MQKNRDITKLGGNWAKSCQSWQKLIKVGIMCILKQKIHDKLLTIEKNMEKNIGVAQKLGQSGQKCDKIVEN